MRKAEVPLTPNAGVLWLRNQDTAQFPMRARAMPWQGFQLCQTLVHGGPWRYDMRLSSRPKRSLRPGLLPASM